MLQTPAYTDRPSRYSESISGEQTALEFERVYRKPNRVIWLDSVCHAQRRIMSAVIAIQMSRKPLLSKAPVSGPDPKSGDLAQVKLSKRLLSGQRL